MIKIYAQKQKICFFIEKNRMLCNIYYRRGDFKKKIGILLMEQFFYMTKNSTLPSLRMELIDDGRSDFHKFQECIQGATITFTMVNADTNVTKIAKAPCYIKKKEDGSCDDKYIICYDWKARDTKESGVYNGLFEITFSSDLTSEDVEYPSGILNMPLREDLKIIIR